MALQCCCTGKMFLQFLMILGVFRGILTARVSDKIYEVLEGDMACFKRFNGTSEVGCTSDFGGNVGVLYVPTNISDAEWALDHGPHPPYILALAPELFTPDLLMIAKDSKNIKGIVILNSEEQEVPSEMSPASTCPSQEYGLYNHSSMSSYSDYCYKNPWNADGNSLLFESFDFPIFLIQDEESIDAIMKCFNHFNKDGNGINIDYPLCAIQLYSNMFGTTSSEVCLRRTRNSALSVTNYCDPIHDYNIYGSVYPMTGELEDSSVIVIAARADAASMFDNISPGADSAVTGIVTLLSIAQTLYQYREEFKKSNKNILFILFEGETWDYLGSSAMTYDMSKGKFPFSPDYNDTEQISTLNFSHIEHFIELNQLGIQIDKSQTKLFMHVDPISNRNSDTEAANNILKDSLTHAGQLLEVSVETAMNSDGDSYNPLPPASLQNFLKYLNISGAVLTDHKKGFANKYYQSFLDNYLNVNFSSTINSTNSSDQLHIQLGKISSTISTAVYNLVTKKSIAIKANDNLIGEMLVCFLRNVNCTLFREHSGWYLDYRNTAAYFQPKPAKMYSSVRGGEDILTNITLYMMAHFLGEEIEENVHECWSNSTSAVQKFFMHTLGENGTCFSSTARKQTADSPAFRIEGYNFSSGEYPTWTESGWSVTSARLFLKPDPSEEIGLILGGVVLIIVTVVLSYWADARANILFVKTPMPVPC